MAILEAWIFFIDIRKAKEVAENLKEELSQIKFEVLRSQINPHFMFNSLNSIKNYILQAEPKIAAEYLSNFSHLIRMILQNSGSKVISLQEELDTLLLYIDLEKLRFDDEFEFNCIVDENINLSSVHIPPMILQPYVENAIWHGLMHKNSSGQLTIELRKAGDRIECIVEDDGVGREAAARLKDKSIRKYRSMGMGITRDRIDIINRMDALGITTTVEDLVDGAGEAAGTRVIVSIPSKLEDDFI
jgi:LytS/YehU family sensor histidine kinase